MESVHKLVIGGINVGMDNSSGYGEDRAPGTTGVRPRGRRGRWLRRPPPGEGSCKPGRSDPVQPAFSRWNDRGPIERHLFEREFRHIH